MGIFSRNSKGILIAIFDIAGSSVGGLLFEHRHGGPPEIICVFRQQADFSPEPDLDQSQRALYKAFESVVNHLKKKISKGRKNPDLIMVVFSSPYYISQTKIIRFIAQKPFEIREKFLDQMISAEVEAFKKEREKEYSSPIELLEKEAMECKLNGYLINNPVSKKARTVELSVYMSLGMETLLNKLKERIDRSFGETALKFQTFPFAAFGALKNFLDVSKGLLLVDIGGESTELALVRGNILEESASFPLGENFLIRRIASVFHFSPEESVSLLYQYARNDLHSGTYEKVRTVIGDAGKKWCGSFNQITSGFSDFSFLPQNRLIIGGRAATALKDFIICTEEQPLQIDFLLPEAFKNHFIFRRGFSEDKDISLMLFALYADKLFLEK